MEYMPKLLYECPSFILMEKPHGLATVPLKKQADENGPKETLLWHAAGIAPQILDVHGKNPWEGGAIHRLDTATSGIVMFAKDQTFYDYMQRAQQNDLFEKYYTAKTVENDALRGININEKDDIITITSYFRPFGSGSKQVRPTLDQRKAQPKQKYTTFAKQTGNAFLCTITKGFRHQIRAHLAWTGHPIEGDQLYCLEHLQYTVQPTTQTTAQHTSQKPAQELQLMCVGIAFRNQQGCIQTFLDKGFSIEEFPHTPWFAAQFAKAGGNGIIEL